MKKKIIASLLLLFTLVGCDGVSSVIDPNVIQDVPTEDRVEPEQTNWDFEDYNYYNASYDQSKWYKNELKSMQLPDPYVINVGDTYYIYGTTDRTAARTVDCYSTKVFNTFTLHKDVFSRSADHWSTNTTGIFAPEVMIFDGKYYMYYSAEMPSNHNMRYIDVVVSDSPTGPYKPFVGEDANGKTLDGSEPIFRHNDNIGYSVLDQTMLVDDDGKMYMYYSVYHTGDSQYIVGFEMLDPVTPNWDTYKVLVRPGDLTPNVNGSKALLWEAYTDFRVAEGPAVIKSPINGKYYLTYSVNHYPDRYYTVCYAYSDTPLGDYTKPFEKGKQWTNLLFGYAGGMEGTKVHEKWEGFMSGTAHHCFFKIGEQWMIGYHAHKNRINSDNGRMFAMDYLFFDEEGVPYTQGPSSSIQRLPEAISGYKNIALDAQVKATNNIKNPERINDNFIVEHYNLKQEEDREVVFEGGVAYLELVFDKEYEIGGIQIVNSAFYDKLVGDIAFINFFDGHAVKNVIFNDEYINYEQEFIFPDSAFTINTKGIRASKVVICLNYSDPVQLNEIIVLGK